MTPEILNASHNDWSSYTTGCLLECGDSAAVLCRPRHSAGIVIPPREPIEERMQGLDALLAVGQIGRDAEALVALESIASGLTLD
ncbi:MAG: hypothetical protein ACRDH2_19755 [Anaerolineales bacterium]